MNTASRNNTPSARVIGDGDATATLSPTEPVVGRTGSVATSHVPSLSFFWM